MMRFLLVSSLILCAVNPAAAQTEGRVSVGGSVTFLNPTDDEVKSVVTGGPLVRLNPRKGWGPAAALSWLSADLEHPSGSSAPFARLRVRPLMAGVAYTIGEQPVLVSFSILAGPSFNKLSLEDEYVRCLPAGSAPQVDAETSVAVRPGVSVTLTVAPRVAIVGFGGYLINRPDVVYRDATTQFTNRWKADAIVLSVGAVYSIF